MGRCRWEVFLVAKTSKNVCICNFHPMERSILAKKKHLCNLFHQILCDFICIFCVRIAQCVSLFLHLQLCKQFFFFICLINQTKITRRPLKHNCVRMLRLHSPATTNEKRKKLKTIFLVACSSLSIHHNSLHFPATAETDARVG